MAFVLPKICCMSCYMDDYLEIVDDYEHSKEPCLQCGHCGAVTEVICKLMPEVVGDNVYSVFLTASRCWAPNESAPKTPFWVSIYRQITLNSHPPSIVRIKDGWFIEDEWLIMLSDNSFIIAIIARACDADGSAK